MLEIFALYFLSKKIGELAEEKGEAPAKWKWIMVGFWFLFEIIGILLVFSQVGEDSLILAVVVGLAFGLTSFLGVRAYLNSKPDVESTINEDVGAQKPNLDHFR